MRTWPRARKGAIHLRGHMLNRLKGTSRSLDVGVDAWAFRPVSLREIRQRLKTLPVDTNFAKDPDESEQNPRPRR
jgi:calcineurin-like phosphoesterase family protein